MSLTPGELALLDQEWTGAEAALDRVVEKYRAVLADLGLHRAAAGLINELLDADHEPLAGLALAAVTRLAQREPK